MCVLGVYVDELFHDHQNLLWSEKSMENGFRHCPARQYVNGNIPLAEILQTKAFKRLDSGYDKHLATGLSRARGLSPLSRIRQE